MLDKNLGFEYFLFSFEELKNTIKSLKNSKKINDFSSIMAQFEDLTKVFEKSKTILARAGDDSPEFYIKCIADLEDFITEVRRVTLET